MTKNDETTINQNILLSNEIRRGLTSQEIDKRLKEFGLNKLPQKKPRSALAILVAQFRNPLIYIITVAAIISLLLNQFEDAIIIGVVIAIDSIVGFFQEYRAEKTMNTLRNLLKPLARVMRAGTVMEIDTTLIVPDDLVMLGPGDKIPADGEFMEIVNLSINEAILTGESEPIMKNFGDRGFMGTTVMSGRGLMQVTATGLNTQLGKIAESMSEIKEKPTPLQTRLDKFGRSLTIMVIIICVAIFLTGTLLRYEVLNMIELSIVLAIAAIPEGLIIAVTMILVIGMRVVLRKKGLVRRLLAVETLGSVSTICTDKTGTLTEGIMQVVRIEFQNEIAALQAMILCNNMEDSLEISLHDYVVSRNLDPSMMQSENPRIHEIPFSSESKYMLTVNLVDGIETGFVKGAPDVVMNFCDLDAVTRETITAQLDEWASSGLKLLGIAFKYGNEPRHLSGYTWNGLIGIQDPIRPSVKDAIVSCRKAGIKIKMITGDYRKTAEKVAQALGLAIGSEQVMEGKELEEIDDEELARIVEDIVVFCRVSPQHKLKIVKALQTVGEITAMIGDGVNDAPALKKADIGVSVGRATDVAQEAASLILLDNNFSTLVNSIEAGRTIFDNIKKVVAYVLSNSFAEIVLIFGTFILGWPAPLTVPQLLWIHLICDGPCDIALGFEKGEKGIMEEPPKSLEENILPVKSKFLIIAISFTLGLICLAIFQSFSETGNIIEGRTIVFSVVAFSPLIYIFSYRSLSRSILTSRRITENKWLLGSVLLGIVQVLMGIYLPGLSQILQLIPLTTMGWIIVVIMALFMIFIVEVFKFIEKKIRGSPISRVSKILQNVQKSIPGINDLNNISVDIMKDKTFIKFAFGIPAETPLEDAHELASLIESRIENEFPLNLRRNLEIISHIEPIIPIGTKVHSHAMRPSSPEIRASITEAMNSLSLERLKHWNHLNTIEEGTDISVSLTAYFDKNTNIYDTHLMAHEIEGEIRRKIPGLKRFIVHSEPE